MGVELRTDRLWLRPRTAEDSPAIIAGLNDWEVVRHLTVVPYPYTEAHSREWLSRPPLEATGQGLFVIDLPGRGLIGIVSLDDHLGYWLARQYHRHGYMTEACAALIAWHFSLLPEDVIRSGIHEGNEASLNVQRKLGFVMTGERTMTYVRSQQRDVLHVGTSLDRAQFEAARQMWLRRR